MECQKMARAPLKSNRGSCNLTSTPGTIKLSDKNNCNTRVITRLLIWKENLSYRFYISLQILYLYHRTLYEYFTDLFAFLVCVDENTVVLLQSLSVADEIWLKAFNS